MLDSRTKYGAAFAQDSWRVAPNFTLNYGLRWEVSMPWYDTQDKIQTIVPGVQSTVFPGAPKGWLVPGDPGIARRRADPVDAGAHYVAQLRARASVSHGRRTSPAAFWARCWAGPGKTSIRAAAGIYYTAIQDAGLFIEVADAPYGLYWVSQCRRCSTSRSSPARTAVRRHSDSRSFCRFRARRPSRIWIGPCSCRSQVRPGYQPGNKLPYAEHFNFSIQRQLSSRYRAHAGLCGHRGTQTVRAVRSQSRGRRPSA